jgi:polyisoprenoid-binding protein YceI
MFERGVVHATFAVESGRIQLSDPPTESKVMVIVNAGSCSPNRARRHTDVVGAGLLDVMTYPRITFASDAVRQAGDQLIVTAR